MVGNVIPTARYAPEVVVQVKVLAVPSSLIRIIKRWPSDGVPDGAAIVALFANAVTLYCADAVVGVIVVLDATVPIIGIKTPFIVLATRAPFTFKFAV